jgi:hypothetical protein
MLDAAIPQIASDIDFLFDAWLPASCFLQKDS